MTESLHTDRLLLRRWTDADRPALRRLNQDSLVMATIGPTLDDKQADGFMKRIDGELSRRVMEKIGLQRDPDDDFEHPAVPPTSPLYPHVVYRLTAAQYGARGE